MYFHERAPKDVRRALKWLTGKSRCRTRCRTQSRPKRRWRTQGCAPLNLAKILAWSTAPEMEALRPDASAAVAAMVMSGLGGLKRAGRSSHSDPQALTGSENLLDRRLVVPTVGRDAIRRLGLRGDGGRGRRVVGRLESRSDVESATDVAIADGQVRCARERSGVVPLPVGEQHGAEVRLAPIERRAGRRRR